MHATWAATRWQGICMCQGVYTLPCPKRSKYPGNISALCLWSPRSDAHSPLSLVTVATGMVALRAHVVKLKGDTHAKDCYHSSSYISSSSHGASHTAPTARQVHEPNGA